MQGTPARAVAELVFVFVDGVRGTRWGRSIARRRRPSPGRSLAPRPRPSSTLPSSATDSIHLPSAMDLIRSPICTELHPLLPSLSRTIDHRAPLA